MTKKDYELIAGALYRSGIVKGALEKNQAKRQAGEAMRRLIANDLAGSLYGANKKFDRNKFLTACGVEE